MERPVRWKSHVLGLTSFLNFLTLLPFVTTAGYKTKRRCLERNEGVLVIVLVNFNNAA